MHLSKFTSVIEIFYFREKYRNENRGGLEMVLLTGKYMVRLISVVHYNNVTTNHDP